MNSRSVTAEAPIIDVTIETLIPGGNGLARHGGKVVFVSGVLPGETVKVRLVLQKRDFDRGEVVQILSASPDRIAPGCAAASTCGGCDWLHIKPAAQARFKVTMARESYQRLGGFELQNLSIETGEPWGYRNRVQMHINAQSQLGFMGRSSAQVTVVPGCPVAHAALQPLFASQAKPGAPKRLTAFGHATRGNLECLRQDNPESGLVKVRILGRDFEFPLAGFFQSNLAMLEKLIPWALQDLSGDLALDLYSGVGLFAAFLKPHFSQVIALEEQSEAADCIGRNAGQGVSVHCGKLEDWSLTDTMPKWTSPPDAVVVDPPREGLHADARRFLLDVAAKKVVYVSCDVATQARDLKVLLAGGYRLDEVKLFDFYPQTHHIEAVARLSRD